MTPETFATARFAILMATYNGQAYIGEQLDTIAQQTTGTIDIWASDDGSSDNTLDILRTYSETWDRGVVHVLKGPAKGFSENFRSLIINPNIDADFYAFADQDDLWDADKLERAMEWLGDPASSQPRLYCGRTRTLHVGHGITGMSPEFAKPPSFQNALVQSLAGGNTMVMNRAAHDLMAQASLQTRFATHDWWAYIVITAAGGRALRPKTERQLSPASGKCPRREQFMGRTADSGLHAVSRPVLALERRKRGQPRAKQRHPDAR